METKDLSISCVIPMYNEEKNVETIITSIEELFSRLGNDWEIIVVESGSTDNTWRKIGEVINGRERIRAFHQNTREGMGSALRLGYLKSTKNIVAHIGADTPCDVIYFKKALPVFLENDCVIGYRVGPREKNFRWSYYKLGKLAFIRGFFHISYNLLLRILLDLRVKDINFSFKMFRREDIQKLKLISKGWFIDAEILLELKRNGILPIEMPVEYKDRTAGKSAANISAPFHMLYELFKYMRSVRKRGQACQV